MPINEHGITVDLPDFTAIIKMTPAEQMTTRVYNALMQLAAGEGTHTPPADPARYAVFVRGMHRALQIAHSRKQRRF